MAEWTAEQVRELCEQRFQSQDRAVAAALAAQEKAVTAALGAAERAVLKAEAAAEKRFESVNEFRASLSDQASLLMPRSEAQVELRNLREKIETLTSKVEAMTGKSAGFSAGWLVLLGAVALLGNVLALLKR
jgi:cobalamin biosynthesis Mg chelatase CobN